MPTDKRVSFFMTDMLYPNLKQLEHRTYRTVVDDGLMDILLGLYVITLGITFFSDINFPGTQIDILPVIVSPLMIPLWRALRRTLIEPRIGYVQLNRSRKAKLQNGWLVTIILVSVLIIGLLALSKTGTLWNDHLRDMRVIWVGLAFSIPLAIAAHLLQLRRWLIHTLVLMTAVMVEYTLDIPYGIGWMVAGGIMMAIGLFLLTNFLRRHPQPLETEYADA